VLYWDRFRQRKTSTELFLTKMTCLIPRRPVIWQYNSHALCPILTTSVSAALACCTTLSIKQKAEAVDKTPQELKNQEQEQIAALARANKTERLAVVNRVARAAGATLQLDDLLETVYQEVDAVFQPDAFFIALYDRETNELSLRLQVDEGIREPPSQQPADVGWTSLVIAGQKPLLIRDYKQEQHHLPPPTLFGTMKPVASWLGAPMRIGEQVIGVISVQAYHPHAYGEEEQFLLSTIADQVAVAVEKARLYEEAQDHLESLTKLNRASQAVVSSLDVKEVLEQIVELAGSVVKSDFTSVVLVDEEGKPVLGTEDFRGISPITQRIRGNGTTRYVLDSRRPLLVDTISDEGVTSPSLRLPDGELIKANPVLVTAGIRSFAAVPIQAKEKILGILFVHSLQPHVFHGQLSLLTTFANQAAVALENARLYEAERKRAAQFAVVNQVARKAVSILDPDQLLQESVIAIQQGFEYHNVILLQLDEATGKLGEQAIAGGFEDIGPPDYYQDVGKGLIGWAAQTGQPLMVNEVSQDPRYVVGFSEQVPTRAELCVPLKLGERVIGVLDVQEIRPNAFDEMDLAAMETLADQIAVAIENSRLFKAEREQRQLTEALKEAASAVSSTLDPDQVLERILEQVEQVVAGDHFNIMLIENDQARVVRQRGYESLSTKDQGADFSRPITRYPSLVKMVQTGEPTVVPDTTTDPDWVYEEDQEWLRSYVATPIQIGDVIVGFLNVNGTQRGKFDMADARRLQAFAAHTATAIENARLHERLREHAERLEERVEERTAQLQAQYARLEAILRSTTDGIIVTDAEGEILQVNPVAQSWLTRTLSPEDTALLQKTAQDLARRAETQPETVLELTGLDLELEAAPIAEPGLTAAAVVAIHDVSHLKALNRMKSRFMSNVSHELRTPITVIKLYTHLMKQQPKRWKEYLDTMAQEADHQAKIIEDILQISRIDAGRLEMKPRLTSLNELTEMTIANYYALGQKQGVTLEHHLAEMKLKVLVDSQRIAQVLSNLVENAIQYTPEGGRVVISTGQEETEGRTWATATVTDTGMGVSEEELPHIFDRFFRGEGPKQMQISGTGLGLALAKDIVELHGGQVTVDSQIGEGSTFTVWLPLAD
jgi:GAF domain-containing protein/nitrogen-specific signal transduction histidine kinase